LLWQGINKTVYKLAKQTIPSVQKGGKYVYDLMEGKAWLNSIHNYGTMCILNNILYNEIRNSQNSQKWISDIMVMEVNLETMH
jgi:hypothetical protein